MVAAAVRGAFTCLLGLALLTGGCSRQLDDVRGSTAYIKDVEFEGVTRFKEDELLAYLHMGETTIWPWKDKFAYLPGNLPVDSARIVEVYKAHGYYDAEVVSITPSVRAGNVRLFARTPGERRPGKASIKVVVREGEPTRVRSLALVFPDGRPVGPTAARLTDDALRKRLALHEGEPFEIPRLNTSVDQLREALQDAGFAYAEVEEEATVAPGRGADVRFTVTPGPYVTIGTLRFEGLGDVPEKYVRYEVEFAEGKPYSPKLVRRIEDAVYGLEVFDTVTVERPPKPDGQRAIDLVVKVRPSKPQSIKLGGGFGFDPVRWDQRATMLYSHRNLGNNLTRFDLRVQAGYAELPSLLRPAEHGPIGRIEPRFRQKGLIEKKTVATLAPAFELGIWEGYQFYSPTLRAGLSRFFGRIVEAELTYNLRFVDFFNVSPTLKTEDNEVLGRDFRDPYLLSYIEPSLRVYLTDSVLKPKNGAIIGVVYDLAGLGGHFSFHRVRPSVRLYWTPHWRLTLAARAELGWIVPFGPRGGAPIDMRFYLGGADTVRGWGLRRLSPQVAPEECEGGELGETGCRTIPVGGNTMILGNIEARVHATKMLSFAGFFDMGDVQSGINRFRASHLNYSAGPGVRLDTPIGTFRLDVGFRLNDTDYALGQKIWALHFGLGEAF